MATMKAAQLRSPGAEFELLGREMPELREDEVLTKIDACGVCHGDAVAKEGLFAAFRTQGFLGTKWSASYRKRAPR